MKVEIYVSGLPENSGPGEILGAITGEANVDGKKIGDIDITGSVATVQASEEVADDVISNLEKISGETVHLAKVEGESPKTHLLKLAKLVELERREEMKRHRREIKTLSGREREDEGRAILHLRGRDEGTGLGGKHLIKLMRQRKGEPLPETEIAVGDLVMLSKNSPLQEDNPTGTVAKKTQYSITVAFDNNPPSFLYGKGVRSDLYVNDITYQRQLEALEEVVESAEGRLEELVKKMLGREETGFAEPNKKVKILDENLNYFQENAVRNALSSKDFYLIHGPPGTGKTVTCIEIARQLIRRQEKVLCTAASNTAVDNLVEWLADRGEKVVRIGHPARVTPTLRNHTLDELIQQNDKYQKSRELREKAMDLVDKQDELTHPSGRWRRGMSDDKIKSLAEEGKGSRGVPASKIEEMAQWLKFQEDIDELFRKVERLEDGAIDEILGWADVICATNSGCGSEVMSGRKFDTVIIDEATQATEPSCWIPITKADRVIMAGDHKQLPPTILSEEARDLSKTLFEVIVENHANDIRSVLKIQYRMNRKIMNFSNKEFYDGILEADPSVEDHTLRDLIEKPPDSETKSYIEEAKRPDPPITLIDTGNIDAPERTRKGSTSKENPKEAEIILSLSTELLASGIEPEEIAIITPYNDQVDLIGQQLEEENLEVDTVDGFQGREKEVVLLSLVRSNQEEKVGFLEDVRRLNVSITRAKRKLIIVADSSTVGIQDTYSRLIDYISRNGKIISAE